MKKIVMAAFAAGLICSAIPAYADDVAASTTANATGAVQTPQAGIGASIGVDLSAAGKTSEEHRAFQAKLSAAQQTTVKDNCKLADKNRTPEEQAYCADLN